MQEPTTPTEKDIRRAAHTQHRLFNHPSKEGMPDYYGRLVSVKTKEDDWVSFCQPHKDGSPSRAFWSLIPFFLQIEEALYKTDGATEAVADAYKDTRTSIPYAQMAANWRAWRELS